MGRYAKLIGALLGGLSPAVVVGVLSLFHVTITVEQVSGVVAIAVPILSALGVYVAPSNKVTVADSPEVDAEPVEAAVPAQAEPEAVSDEEVLDPSVLV